MLNIKAKVMKKIIFFLMMAVAFTACDRSDLLMDEEMTLKSLTEDGTKLTGEHFNLNIIGVKEKTMDDDIDAGHVIFVLLGEEDNAAVTEIGLIEGPDFAVLDKNGTDGEASFQLPDPDLDPYVIGEDLTNIDTESAYSVWIRPLGKPGGMAEITTIAELMETNVETFLKNKEYRDLKDLFTDYPNAAVVGTQLLNTVEVERKRGKQKFVDVTGDLLTVVYEITIFDDTDMDGVLDEGETILDVVEVRIPIFDPMLEGEFWEYSNEGLKLLQIRFYPGIPSDVSDWDSVPE